MKKCSKCKIKKNLSDFYRCRSSKDGHKGVCKECENKYFQNTREKRLEYSKQYYIDNGEKAKQYYEDHKEEILLYKKQYYESHKEKKKQYAKKYREIHKEEIKLKKRQYEESHREQINQHIRFKLENNINFKIGLYLRNRLRDALKGNFKSGSAVRDLGFVSGNAIENVKLWLEQQLYFIPEANERTTWENYGKLWHIDHIIPLCNFDLSDPKQLKKACHWFNLRPLWVKENLSRNNKIDLLK